jgi:predicted nucleic acid-binding protein
MKALLDTNVILDVLLGRKPHVQASAAIWAAIETGKGKGFLPAHAITTIYYLSQKQLGSAQARRMIRALLQVFTVAAVDEIVLKNALDLNCPDFEDAVTVAAAQNAGCELLITRNPRDFRDAPLPIFTPEAALPLLSNGGSF